MLFYICFYCVNSKSKVRFYLGQTSSPFNCYAPPIPQPRSSSPSPRPCPQNKVKTTLGQKVACYPPSPNPMDTLPPPHLCHPPCWDRGGGKNPIHGPRSKHTLCQNMSSTIEVRTIRVKRPFNILLS
jgi:hypothetical protein